MESIFCVFPTLIHNLVEMTNNIRYLVLKIGGYDITAPTGVPEGGINTGSKIIQAGLSLFLIAGILITLFYIIQAGIQWTTSRGDKQLIEQARLRLTYAIVGLVIMLLSFFIISLVFGFFNINFF